MKDKKNVLSLYEASNRNGTLEKETFVRQDDRCCFHSWFEMSCAHRTAFSCVLDSYLGFTYSVKLSAILQLPLPSLVFQLINVKSAKEQKGLRGFYKNNLYV